ncbi:MAG: hypothetical protein L6R42_000232 [Xanthoria sp. 1 TBL-2021]|nr:MAG: hypothetical protein L6R42_000232 [Xanthoria sp. 1 TBL-2021]
MKRYARYWSSAIRFLIRLNQEKNSLELARFYLYDNNKLRRLVRSTIESSEALLAIGLDYPDLQNLFNPRGYDSPDAGSLDRRLHANDLYKEVQELSYYLVRFRFEGSSFTSPLVGFMALNALDHQGAWIAAHNFTSFISGVIHCMQLWLLGYRYLHVGDSAGQQSLLEESVRTECRQYLVNTTATAAAELLYWRLLTWTASNDTVHHPVTTMNADCTQVNHSGIELNIDSWRGALRELLGSAEDLLAESLLLGLDNVPIYTASTMYDTPSDTRPGKSFLDDPRNRLPKLAAS